MTSFQLLLRVLDEQCKVTGNEAGEPVAVEPRSCKEAPADSLQNPSDPDAGYDAHKGQGYQVQVMETYSDEDDPEKKSRQLDLNTCVEVESASEHDAKALTPATESAKERGLGPEEILADSHYGGDENVAAAEEAGVELVAPAMGSKKEGKLGLDDFEFTETGEVSKCPAGHAPVKKKNNRKKGRYSVAFNSDVCADCPHAANCPAKPGKKKHRYLRYADKELRLALRRQAERTPEFKKRYRMRAGVEATMSDLDRMTNASAGPARRPLRRFPQGRRREHFPGHRGPGRPNGRESAFFGRISGPSAPSLCFQRAYYFDSPATAENFITDRHQPPTRKPSGMTSFCEGINIRLLQSQLLSPQGDSLMGQSPRRIN